MLNFRKIIRNIAIYAVTFCVMPNVASAVDFYAKVVFIGEKGSGKTTLFKLLTEQTIDFNNREPTHQINADGFIVNVKAKVPDDKEEKNFEVQVVLNDCPVEGFTNEGFGMNLFFKNADIVFLTLNAQDYLTVEGMTRNGEKLEKGLFLQNPKNEQTMSDFTRLFSDCRVIVVLTQLDGLSTSRNTRELTKTLVKSYIEKVMEQGKFGSSVDGFFDITLKNKDSKEERGKYLASLIEAIKKSLVKRIEKGKLSNKNVKMTGRLTDSVKVIDEPEERFLFFWVKKPEKFHMTDRALDGTFSDEFIPKMKKSSTMGNLFKPSNSQNSKK